MKELVIKRDVKRRFIIMGITLFIALLGLFFAVHTFDKATFLQDYGALIFVVCGNINSTGYKNIKRTIILFRIRIC